MSRGAAYFSSVRTEGGLLPADILGRVHAGDKSLEGTAAATYHLGAHERIGEAVNRSWTRLTASWHAFQQALEKEPENSPATGLTRDRWLLPLFQELGYGRLPRGTAIEIDNKSYAISHNWHRSPIHLLGWGVDLDKRQKGVAGAAQSSPHGLVQEFLNQSDDHLWGFLSNGKQLRVLRDHYSLTRQAYIEFDLQAVMDGEQYSDFLLLWLICHQSRVEADKPEECWLEKWFSTSRDEGVRALDKLRAGVEKAIEALGTGFLKHKANTPLRSALESGDLTNQDYYRQILRLVYRLIFIFVAEDRDALLDPRATDAAKDRYHRFYSARRFRLLAEKRRGTPHGDLWQALRLIMQMLDKGCPDLALPGLGSLLWSDAACPDLMTSACSNEHLLEAIRRLSYVQEGKTRYPVNWRNIGAEELGSIYESLLELHPRINKEAGSFDLDIAAGHERKTTGSYYTPTSLVDCLLDSALDPVLDEAAKKPDPEKAILDLTVCDPACGSGHFLVAAARRIAKRLASIRSGDAEPSPSDLQQAIRDVVGRCIYGVDLNPMAVELCKVSLWMEAVEPGLPLAFLDSHIRHGNALLGTTPELMEKGIPDDAWKPIEGDDKKTATALRKRNKQSAQGQRGLDSLWSTPNQDEPAKLARSFTDLETTTDDDISSLARKESKWKTILDSEAYRHQRFVADAWCAAFVWPKQPGPLAKAAPTNDLWLQIRDRQGQPPELTVKTVNELVEQYSFLHWHLAFPQVFVRGGFDVVLGNPPWEKIQVEEEGFFASRFPTIATATSVARKKQIAELLESNPAIALEWQKHRRNINGLDHLLKSSGRYPLSGAGKLNSYAVFAENASAIVAGRGSVGYIVPLGLVADRNCQRLFWELLDTNRIHRVSGFENEALVFSEVHHSFKFALCTIGGKQNRAKAGLFKFYCRSGEEARDIDGHFVITPDHIRALNPASLTCPVLHRSDDLRITYLIYSAIPAINSPTSGWDVRIHRILNASDDAPSFVEIAPEHHRLRKHAPSGSEGLLPVFEAKMFHQFDHRFGTYVGQSVEQSNQGKLPEFSDELHMDPNALSQPRYWISEAQAEEILVRHEWQRGWLVAVRDVTSPVVFRTVISACIPRVPSVHTVWNLFLRSKKPNSAAILLGAFNSFVLDFVARQKISGVHLSAFIIEQLPVPSTDVVIKRSRAFLGAEGSSWYTQRILELAYTAWDLEAFANDMGYDGPPFRWDPARRFLLRAELDAAFFHLYGIERDDVDYIMDTFPIVQKNDEKALGEYRTKRVILEIYNKMQEAIDTGKPYRTLLDPPPADPRVAHPPR